MPCRIWCIFELYTASLKNEDIKVTIVMPPQEKQSMSKTIGMQGSSQGSRGIDQLYQAFGRTKVENAVASQEEDRTNILAMVEKGPGFKPLNLRVNDLLRQWVKDAVLSVMIRIQRKRQVDDDGEHKQGTVVRTRGLARKPQTGPLTDNQLGHYMTNVGCMFQKNFEIQQVRTNR